MMKGVHLLLVVLFGALCGCVQQSASKATVPPNLDTLEHGQILYVAVPKDIPILADRRPNPDGHFFDDKRFPGTGAHTATLMHGAFAPYASRVIVGKGYETLEQALVSAKTQNARYIFILDFDIILMRHRIMWQPRRYAFILHFEIFDALREGKPREINIRISGEQKPSYRMEHEMEGLRGPMMDLAKYVFEGRE
jgi:hypothetical protein